MPAPDRHSLVGERDALIVALAKSGLAPMAIAARHGFRRQLVCTVLFNARRRGEAVPRFTSRGRPITDGEPVLNVGFKLEPDTAQRLHAEAAKRGFAASSFARALVLAVLEDDLVAAVLDP